MTVVLGPTRAYEQRDQLQWSGLWDVISLETLCWEIWDKSRSWNKVQFIGTSTLKGDESTARQCNNAGRTVKIQVTAQSNINTSWEYEQ